jgi:YYY domain-containing protein
MYWEDTPDKRERFVSNLNQADYVIISSSRQWASVGRMPERYPLSAAYYRGLLGCPDDLDIETCYNQAQLGMYQGKLGFDLVKIFESSPSLGLLVINDQASEEAFTVYDHPKVFIFRKTTAYDPSQVRMFLDSVDLEQIEQTASIEDSQPDKDLLLTPQRLEEQQAGGSWTELFAPESLVNRYEWLAVLVWYISLGVVGLLVYPLLRLALPGLADGGYPFARTAGLLIFSYLVWISGSFRLPVERPLITGMFGLIAVLGGWAAYRQRETLKEQWRSNRRYYLLIEGLFLAFFLFGLLIRIGNPDLWHPWKGGEKPMDFSYFNAVLKSTSFPPYDPWYAGGYINYYYYGFVFVGVLVKWLGINPAVAYNLILPTLFGLMGLGAFSIGWNLRQHTRNGDEGWRSSPWLTGGAAGLGMVLLGNLGILRMILRGYQRLGGSGASLEEVSFLTRWFWGAKGFLEALSGAQLPYALADWYWFPSRAIPAPGDVEPITEFPFFTFLYADLHAHLIALPITLLVLAWALSVVLRRGRWGGFGRGFLGFLLGGLAIGALRPTNTWDFYPYLAIGAVAIVYAVGRYYRPGSEWVASRPRLTLAMRGLLVLSGVATLVLLAHILYQPYATWYGQGYNTAGLWQGTRTPTFAYFDHWGVFLFFIISWMIWETREWMANTPLSALRVLEPYKGVIQAAVVVLLAVIIGFLIMEIPIAWIVLILGVWAGTLLFRPGLPDSKRVVLFLVGTGLLLTLMVEVVVLQGDIGRMNTVFKFYLQSWTLFAVSAAAAFGWLLTELPRWTMNWRRVWQFSAAFLVGAAALYPLLGSIARIKDRMTPEAPHTLDGMAYMAYSTYNDLGTVMDLSQDYRAIHWLQENVSGSPVIVEANMVEYHWGTRFTIYTGLPNVVGWNWHQRQQRAILTGGAVEKRVADVNDFYRTTSLEAARTFLETYDVSYIILGQLERVYYQGDGLEKFPQFNGVIWNEVYRDQDTVIYKVLRGEQAAR